MTTRGTGTLRATGSAAHAGPRAAPPASPGATGLSRSALPRPPHGAAGGEGTRGPRADCTADSAGGLTFDVRPGDAPAGRDGTAVTGGGAGNAALLLRRRGGGEGPADEVRLPLGPAGTDGTLRAVLPSIMTLPEGRWDAYLAPAEAEPRRLLPGVNDLRSLIDRVPRRGRTWLGVRIPYATKYGNLTVRSWLRWPHAEAGRLRVTDCRMLLRGRLYGARLSSTARLEAHARGAAATPVAVRVSRACEVSGAWDASGALDAAGAYAGGDGARSRLQNGDPASEFAAELSLADLPPAHQVWDLWLRPGEGAEPVRLARILDDVPDKKDIFSYPPQRVADAAGERAVRPYYTLDNDLSVRVSCAEAV